MRDDEDVDWGSCGGNCDIWLASGYILKVKPQFSDGLDVVGERNRSQKQFHVFILDIWKDGVAIYRYREDYGGKAFRKKKKPEIRA